MRIALHYLAAFCICSALGEAEDSAGLARKIMNANRDYANSITSFHVEFQLAPSDDPKFPTPNFTWTHARSARREVFFTDPSSLDYATFGRVWCGTDGSEGVNYTFAVSNSDRVQRIDRTPGSRPVWLDESPISRSLGWSCLQFGSITSLMEMADPQDLSIEPAKIWMSADETLEFPAIKWRLKKFRDREDLPEHEILVWFSENHGWLPRMIVVVPVGLLENKLPTQLPAGSRVMIVAVTAFSEIEDPLLGKPRHFPRTIRRTAQGWETVNVTSAILNQPVDKDLLRPEIGDGVLLVDKAGSPSERRQYVGGEETGRQLHQNLVEENREFLGLPPARPEVAGPISAKLAMVDATPESLRWGFGWTLSVGSLALLLIVGLYWVRFGGGSSSSRTRETL